MPTTARKRNDLKRHAKTAGQQKKSFAPKATKITDNPPGPDVPMPSEPGDSTTYDIDECVVSDAPGNVSCENEISEPSNLVPNLEISVPESQSPGDLRLSYDLGDIVDGTYPITSLSRSDIYAYYTNKSVIPDELFSKKVTKGGKTYTQHFNRKWLEISFFIS